MLNELPAFLERYRTRVDRCLETVLARLTAPDTLLEAIRYSLFNGGKRIRPALVYSTAQALKGEDEPADRAACAVELIHSYSLVHDDLPAMDDDALRRGKPTTHLAYGDATAILAGDAMQALAFELLSAAPPQTAERAIAMVGILARACGAEGMVAGQMIDLQATGKEIGGALLESMHLQKTAALISASVRMGALCAESSPRQIEALKRFGDCLGLAFQIQDDILDVEGSEQVMGKRQGADELRDKATYVSLHGLAGAKVALAEASMNAHEAIAAIGEGAEELHRLTDFVISRSF